MGNALVRIRATEQSSLTAEQKEEQLLGQLAHCGSIIVALSGGADSAYLAWAAQLSLGERALSVPAPSPSFSAYDRAMVEDFVFKLGVHHEFVETHEMDNAAYRANEPDRCYYCKDELFEVLDKLAVERKFEAVCYGVNADDTSDFRPGHRAASEHRVLAPLLDALLAKVEIRMLSERAGLPTWDRPASACLSSRLPYGTEVTPERLALVERGESALRELGFRQFRVSLHDKMARVEISPEDMPLALSESMAARIAQKLKKAGFTYVALDLEGYRQGSLNESITKANQSPVKVRRGT